MIARRLPVAFVLTVGVAVDPLAAQTTAELKAVRFAAHGGFRRVVLDLERQADYRVGWLSAPTRLYVDLVGIRPARALQDRTIAVNDGLVRLIRIGRPQAAVTRVVVELRRASETDVFWLAEPPRLVVDLGKPAPVSATVAPPPAVEAPPAPAPTASPPPAPEAPAPAPAPPATPASATAAEPERSLQIPRVGRPPRLAEYADGAIREAEVRVEGFVQRTPGDGLPVSRPTSAFLSYDDDNLYAVFVCGDEPRRVRAHVAKREVIAGDDRVTLMLDTFNDHRRAYVFSANAFGIQQDSISTEGQADDGRFDTVWHAQGRRTPHGYVVWMAIPFKSLRFPARSAQTWGIALGRVIPRNNEAAYWPHISRRVPSVTAQMAALTGIERVTPTRNVQLIPYGAFTRARLLGPADTYTTSRDARGGLDAKVVVRNALSFDATLNPDFSQVESDDPQVTINQRFEVFFPEKRPFFIENAGFFQTPINLFFSRRIIDPEFGGRLTGKMGRWALGVLAADDRAAGRQLSAGDSLRDSRAGIGALRLQREVGRQSTVGMLATSRVFGAALNNVAAIDTRLQLDARWSLTGQLAASHDRRRDGQRLDGTASFAQLQHAGQHFSYLGRYTDVSPGFRSQPGFIQRVDIRQASQYAGYFWQPEASRLSSFGPSVSAGGNWDHRGQLQDWFVLGDFAMDFTGPAGFNVSRYEAYELFLGTGFRHSSTSAGVYSSQLKWLSVSASYALGTGINYAPPDDLTPFLGDEATGNATLTLRPTPRLRVDQAFIFSRLAARPGSPSSGSEPGVIFRNQLWRTKVYYQFSKALSARAIFDYDDTFTNPALIAELPSRRLRADVLITYLAQPGTALYIGYTDRYQNDVVGSPWTPTASQLFVKVSYLFRY